MTKTRIGYIDAIRGITIILVVYSHILLAARIPIHTSKINDLLTTVRMPLFFFISGYFVYSARYTASLFARRAKNRLTGQLYPTLVCWTMACLLFTDRDFSVLPFDTWKQGYWFTVAAVEMFFLTAPLFVLLSGWKAPRSIRNLVLITGGILLEYLLLEKIDVSNSWVGLFSLRAIRGYFPFFLAGILFKLNEDMLSPVLTNRYTAGIAFLLFVLGYNKVIFLPRFCDGILGILFIHYAVYRLFCFKTVSQSSLAGILCHIGTMTLEIYLLHYFCIHALDPVWKNGWLAAQVNTWAELPLVLTSSVVIVSMCLAIVRVLKQIRLYPLLFPAAKRAVAPASPEPVRT
ncbi:MAG: acyltransferase family protein [Coprobacter sp.]|nr:acyltransferase family protein [Coprobacter sp.]